MLKASLFVHTLAKDKCSDLNQLVNLFRSASNLPYQLKW